MDGDNSVKVSSVMYDVILNFASDPCLPLLKIHVNTAACCTCKEKKQKGLLSKKITGGPMGLFL